MALKLNELKDGKILEVQVSGKLTGEDYQHWVPEFERLTKKHGKINVLFEMSGFHGWNARALWDDIKFDFKHFNHIGRLGIIGDKKWEQWMTVFCKPFTTATVRYFDVSDTAKAHAWIESESAQN